MSRNFSPNDAVDRYLRERETDVSESTIRNLRSALNRFADFCDKEGIEEINGIDGFHLADFRLIREEEVESTTVYNNLSAVRIFIRWCESRDLVTHGLADGMTVPNREGEVRDTSIDGDRAEKIIQYLETYEYASFRHTLFVLLWHTGIRTGTVRGIDLGDFNTDEKYVEIQHRPESGTPLKNGKNAERYVVLSSEVSEVIENYTKTHRDEVEDSFGRKPLLTTRHGRPSTSTIQRTIYRVTQPCVYANQCPHDRNIQSCDAADYNHASECPSSISPHPIRRGAITEWLNGGHAKRILSDRMDLSVEVLEKHYDVRTETEKRKLRSEALDLNQE